MFEMTKRQFIIAEKVCNILACAATIEAVRGNIIYPGGPRSISATTLLADCRGILLVEVFCWIC